MKPIFDAVLDGPGAVRRLVTSDPTVVHERATRDRLIASIPHHLYVGDTALHLAAAGLDLETARVLLAAEADVRSENRRGATPLHYACDARPQAGGKWDPSAQASLITLLVENGADIDRADKGGATPLHRAVRGRAAAAVRRLLELGADARRRLKQRGSSPLHLAVQSTGAGGTAGTLAFQLEIVDLLLSHGANPDAPDADGRTPRAAARNEAVRDALGARPRRR